MITFLFGVSLQARAEPQVEISGATGFGVFAAGVTSGRFAISPSASLSVRGDRGFFVARDTVSFLGATGGRFGLSNETTLGIGLFWEFVNMSAGLSLAAYSLPICGPRRCGQMRGLAPGVSTRLDIFGPYLSGAIGASVDCSGVWITGDAASFEGLMTIHIATSADLGAVVRRGLSASVCFVSDNWLVGPCLSAPDAHALARCDYWGLRGRERSRFLGSFDATMKAIDSDQRVVVWMSRLGSDTVALWALCAWRLLRWPNQPNLDLVVLGGPSEADDPLGVGGGFIRVTPSDVRRSLEHVQSLSLTRVREMALFWRKLSGRSPILSGKGGSGARERKKLVELGSYQAAFLPRFDGRALFLSHFDALLFSCLGKQWSTAVDVFVHQSQRLIPCVHSSASSLLSCW